MDGYRRNIVSTKKGMLALLNANSATNYMKTIYTSSAANTRIWDKYRKKSRHTWQNPYMSMGIVN
jgi:hypothetical protein